MIFFKSLIKVFANYSMEKKWVFFRAIKLYFIAPHFRVNTLIEYFRNSSGIKKSFIRKKLMLKYGFELGLTTQIGENFRVEHFNGVVLGGGVVIGDNCVIYQNVTIGQKGGKYPRIKDNVTLFPGSIVLGNVVIEDNAIVGAGAVVLQDVAKNKVAVGVPARQVGN